MMYSLFLGFIMLSVSSGSESSSDNSLPSAWFNGMNVPWDSYGADIGGGGFDSSWFEKFFSMCNQNGVNVARYWLHANGYKTPTFNTDGSVSGLSSNFLSDLTLLADLSQKHQVVLQIALWSFDMCKDEGQPNRASLISNAGFSKSYVTNALLPMLQVLNKYAHIIIEVANEPEWCIKGPGTTSVQVQRSEFQRFTAMIAEAVHQNSHLKVTTGSAALKWNSDHGTAEANYWSDAALQTAYPSQVGKLDFYNVHFYDWMVNPSWGYDPCRANVSYWGMDKPVVVAELPPTSSYYSTTTMMNCALKNGFMGDMFWAYNDPAFPYTAALPSLQAFARNYSDIASFSALVSWLSRI
jgi:hypothetical protein